MSHKTSKKSKYQMNRKTEIDRKNQQFNLRQHPHSSVAGIFLKKTR